MAVRPQVEAGYTAFVVMPSWMYLTARTVALLDARAIGGRLFAVIVSVPTTAAEIRAVSGLSSVGAHHIFIEGATAPPSEDEALQVQEGALIRLLPPAQAPTWEPPLSAYLAEPSFWDRRIRPPDTGNSPAVLLLHDTGKFIFSRWSGDTRESCDNAAVFMGLDPRQTRMTSADPAALEPLVHRGTPMRGVVAVSPFTVERDPRGHPVPYIVFLDTRPIGHSPNFVRLAEPFISRQALATCAHGAPDGWRIVVSGGRRRQGGFEVYNGEVLVLAFQEIGFGGDLDEGSESEDTPDPTDSSSGHGPDSSTSTRSRTPRRGGQERDPSSDHSYQHGLPPTSEQQPEQDAASLIRCVATPCRSTAPLPVIGRPRDPPAPAVMCVAEPSEDVIACDTPPDTPVSQEARLASSATALVLRARTDAAASVSGTLGSGHGKPALISLQQCLDQSCVSDAWPRPSSAPDAALPLAYGRLSLEFSWHDVCAFLAPQDVLSDWADLNEGLGARRMQQFLQMPDDICSEPLGTAQHHTYLITDGSFTAPQVLKGPLAGWACVVVSPSEGTISAFSGPFPPWHDYELFPASAHFSECYALVGAAWFAAASLPGRHLTFVADCTSAHFGASGQQAVDAAGPPGIMQAMHRLCQVRRTQPAEYRYVAAHRGNRYNELADLLAKLAAKGGFVGAFTWDRPGLSFPWWRTGGATLSWFASVLARQLGDFSFPSPWGCPLGPEQVHPATEADRLVAPFLPPEPDQVTPHPSAFSTLSVRIASYNVLTLADSLAPPDLAGPATEGIAYRPARAQLLAQSMQQHDIHVAGLQEARSEAGTTSAGQYIRFT